MGDNLPDITLKNENGEDVIVNSLTSAEQGVVFFLFQRPIHVPYHCTLCSSFPVELMFGPIHSWLHHASVSLQGFIFRVQNAVICSLLHKC